MATLIELTHKKDGRVFKQVKFCADALNRKNAFKDFHKYIKVAGRCVLATDGHRLHHARLASNALESGYYKVTKLTKTIIHLVKHGDTVTYPDVKPIFQGAKVEYDELWDKIRIGEDYTLSFTALKVYRALQDSSHYYNLDFIDSLQGETWRVCMPTKPEKPLVAKGRDMSAFIMPLRSADY